MSSIQTTHVGSLPRSKELSEFLFAKDRGENFNQSNFVLKDILKINLIDSKFVNFKKQYFSGTFEILIYDHSKLYRFFQTKKKYRKKIESIYITTKYDFLKNNLILEKVIIDKNSNEKINNLIKQ